MTRAQIERELRRLADPSAAAFLQRYFKTGPGQYGANDRFRGIRVPLLRKVASQFRDTPLSEIQNLLKSAFHEDRLVALLILIRMFSSADEALQSRIFKVYLSHTKYINNWDLVDCSAGRIVGQYLESRDRRFLDSLARSQSVWERRIAIIATMAYIKNGEIADTLRIAEILVKDREDLIHKAVGWMLREVAKHDAPAVTEFLRRFPDMPRTMLRYAIERFPEKERKFYLSLRESSRG